MSKIGVYVSNSEVVVTLLRCEPCNYSFRPVFRTELETHFYLAELVLRVLYLKLNYFVSFTSHLQFPVRSVLVFRCSSTFPWGHHVCYSWWCNVFILWLKFDHSREMALPPGLALPIPTALQLLRELRYISQLPGAQPDVNGLINRTLYLGVN